MLSHTVWGPFNFQHLKSSNPQPLAINKIEMRLKICNDVLREKTGSRNTDRFWYSIKKDIFLLCLFVTDKGRFSIRNTHPCSFQRIFRVDFKVHNNNTCFDSQSFHFPNITRFYFSQYKNHAITYIFITLAYCNNHEYSQIQIYPNDNISSPDIHVLPSEIRAQRFVIRWVNR